MRADSMRRFLVIAGTRDGRRLVADLSGMGAEVCAAVATEYGRELMADVEKAPGVTLLSGRMDEEQMRKLLMRFCPDAVINAAHPYAVEVSRNCKGACEETGVRYFRLVRDSRVAKGAAYVETMKQAAAFLNGVEGIVFSACGSKEIDELTAIEGYRERVTVRALPAPEFLQACLALGFASKNMICMQGPFSRELNVAMLRSTKASWLLTKDSGEAGGFAEKIEAADELGVSVVVIGRPRQDRGLGYDELLDMLRREFLLSLSDETESQDK